MSNEPAVIKLIPHSELPSAIESLRQTLLMMDPGCDLYQRDMTDDYWCLKLSSDARIGYMRWAMVKQGYVKAVLPDESLPAHNC